MKIIKMDKATLKDITRKASEAFADDPVHKHCTKVKAIRKRFLYHFMMERFFTSNGEDIIYLDEEKRGMCIWRDAKNDYTAIDFLRCPHWIFLAVYWVSLVRTLIIYARRDLSVFPDNTLLIEPVFVAKEHQGKGVASSLIRRGIADLAPLGYNLGLETQNPDNVPVYEKLGFKVISKKPLLKGKIDNYSMIYMPDEIEGE